MQDLNLRWSDKLPPSIESVIALDGEMTNILTQDETSMLISELDNAITNEEFQLHYQPQVDAKNGQLVGFEALIRWHSPILGNVPPDKFIPIAEDSGQILAIGEWVINRACIDLARLNKRGLCNIHIAVNVSSVQVQEQDIYTNLMEASHLAKINLQDIHIELTETALIKNTISNRKKLSEIKNAGIEIWLDDFGTGYASLSMLQKYPISGLKIDKSFISRVEHSDMDFTICSAIVAMAQRLGLSIVAEGIENDMQMRIISQLGCNRAQGYLISKPTNFDSTYLRWC